MQEKEILTVFSEFLKSYDPEAKDAVWENQSQVFRDFWREKVLNKKVGELEDSEIDEVVRILDRNAKGNTRGAEAIAKMMIPQGVWRKMFNEIKAHEELSSLLDRIFQADDDKQQIGLINKLYQVNETNKNSLTGKSGNALNALLFAYNPKKQVSVVSLRDRAKIISFFSLPDAPDLETGSPGERIVLSNKALINGFGKLGLSNFSPRTISFFLYGSPIKEYWRLDDDSEEAVPWGGIKQQRDQKPEQVDNGDPSLFYMESQLEDFLIENWDRTELGKKYDLIEENDEVVSQQFKTDIGRIDILAKDKRGGQLVVIELKKDQTSDDTVGQLTRYMGWLEEHKTKGKLTKGIIIAAKYDRRLYYALKKIKDVEVYLYQVDFKLQEFKEK